MFKEFYSENLYRAVFTFPKFTRNYSKNYKSVQYSFKKVSKKKKTLVLDIDETLVYATTNRNELRAIDETIFIKMTKFGASVKAYLSYRPYLFQMLDTLRNHFELILYTCGTASYAAAFAESVEKNGGKRYFDHVLSLQHCLYSMENEIYIKDLKILEEGRSLKDIVIVDNTI
jgi:TFIIF-interacting CTD phosphatase-like protein